MKLVPTDSTKTIPVEETRQGGPLGRRLGTFIQETRLFAFGLVDVVTLLISTQTMVLDLGLGFFKPKDVVVLQPYCNITVIQARKRLQFVILKVVSW